MSEQWQDSLPSGGVVQVQIVADQSALALAANRLAYLGDVILAIDCKGMNLHAAAGRLCLVQIAFRDTAGLQCFLFDVVQLGEHIRALQPFLENPQISKLINNAQMHATVFAHKFGITLKGVVDVQYAYEALNGKPHCNIVEILEWCGVSGPNAREEAARMDRQPESWINRPLSMSTLRFAVHSICNLLAAGPVLYSRLDAFLGQNAAGAVTQASQHRVQMAAAAGWACRRENIWVQQADDLDDRNDEQADQELDDWLARRFNTNPAGKAVPGAMPAAAPAAAAAAAAAVAAVPGTAAQRSASQGRAAQLAPPMAIKPGDSPRTASWRAAVARMAPQRADSPGRQRSSSPSLQTWLDRRSEAKADGQPAVRRASSMPAKKREEVPQPWDEPPLGVEMQDFVNLEQDRRAWAEMLEEEDQLHDTEQTRKGGD